MIFLILPVGKHVSLLRFGITLEKERVWGPYLKPLN